MKKNIVFENIKLIIWDLDDTLWKGTFAEGKVKPYMDSFNLINKLNHRGIISSICSKNDKEQVVRFLAELGVVDYFVFSSINYDNKADRIRSTIKYMNLKEENCLFIDDNVRNLGEALFLMPKLMVSTPEIVKNLILISDNIGKDDFNLSRLKQYKVLEKKKNDLANSFNEKTFLKQSKIQIVFHRDLDFDLLDRIIELNRRAHQLNYTKINLSRDDIPKYIDNKYDCVAIECKDKYGYYGFIGFYVFSKTDNKLIHFFFSCRTLGMHIEQFVYQKLNFPKLDIVEPVTSKLYDNSKIDYIKVVNSFKTDQDIQGNKKNEDILLIGPCDLETVNFFLPWNPITEFRHYDEQNRLIGYGSHPLILENVLKNVKYSPTPFFNSAVNDTSIFSKKYKLVIYSYITALLYGEYKNKKTKESIVFGEWTFDATSKSKIPSNVSVGFHIDDSYLSDFSKNYYCVGRVDPLAQFLRIKAIVDELLSNNTKVCLLLGSEIKYEKEKKLAMIGAEEYSRKLNNLLKKAYLNNKNVFFVDPSHFIRGQFDYNGSIQHYSRYVYKKIADSISSNYKFVKKNKVKKSTPALLAKKSCKTRILIKFKNFIKK